MNITLISTIIFIIYTTQNMDKEFSFQQLIKITFCIINNTFVTNFKLPFYKINKILVINYIFVDCQKLLQEIVNLMCKNFRTKEYYSFFFN